MLKWQIVDYKTRESQDKALASKAKARQRQDTQYTIHNTQSQDNIRQRLGKKITRQA